MSLADKQRLLECQLGALRDTRDRLAWMVNQARQTPPMPVQQRTDDHRVEGCLSTLWLTAEFKDGCCWFQAESDSMIVKAVAGLLCDFYSGTTPDEILAHCPDFLRQLGIDQHLTPNRRNALSRVWTKIRSFAEAASTGPGGGIPLAQTPTRFYDAHNHLQDGRFASRQASLIETCRQSHVARMVVNGSSEADWPEVLALARAHPEVIPAFGCHPWYVQERTVHWQETLIGFLDAIPSAVGEIGLDRWKPDLAWDFQEEVFVWQLRLAAERNLPVCIHCLRAWGKLHDLLRANPLPSCGFLLHSYGGPKEMIAPLADLGAYFSFPGCFLAAAKVRQRETFKAVPADRLLLETDAPDQLLPDADHAWETAREAMSTRIPLTDPVSDKPINHPANLATVYQGAAVVFEESVESLAVRVEKNFHRLFGHPA